MGKGFLKKTLELHQSAGKKTLELHRTAGKSVRGIRTGGDNRAAKKAGRIEKRNLRRATRRQARMDRIKYRQDKRTERKAIGGGKGFSTFVDKAAETVGNIFGGKGQDAVQDIQSKLGIQPREEPGDFMPLETKSAGFTQLIPIIIIAGVLFAFNMKKSPSKKR